MRQGWEAIKEGAGIAEAMASCDGTSETLAQWVARRLPAWGISKNDVVRRSRLNSTFAYQILAGTRHASRDKLIQLAFGLALGIDDTCDLLEHGGVNALSPRCRRDVAIAYCLHHAIDLALCDDMLWELGEKTLVGSGEKT